ncbi:hypothetical protein ACWENS_05440 [Streptomyces sp. NPDC004532]
MSGQSAEQQPATTPDPAAVRNAVTRLAVLGALRKQIGDAYAAAKREAHPLLEAQYKATGTTKSDALLPDDTKVGSVSRQGGEREAQVTDEDAFRVWVRDNFPTEHVVELVTTVRPGFAAKVLAEATATGAARYVDTATGVVHDVPGVEIRPTKAAEHKLTYGRGSKAQPLTGHQLVAEAWREHRLDALIAPALMPAPADGGEQ